MVAPNTAHRLPLVDFEQRVFCLSRYSYVPVDCIMWQCR